MIICSIYDKATEAYMRPFVAQTAGQATRMFLDELSNPEHPMAKHPEDYSLAQLGTFTDHDGTVVPNYKMLARAHELLAIKANKTIGEEG